jgi:hypothetical protein
MRGKLRRWWPVLKLLLGLAIVAAVGRRFGLDLQRPEVWRRPLHPGWLALSGVLYLAGLGMSALYWRRLLGHLGVAPALGPALRACYLGHLGKYLPGKAWALLLRAELVAGQGVGRRLGVLTAFYEVLTTMASGVLLAALLFAVWGTGSAGGLDADALRSLARLEVPEGGVLGRWPAVLAALLLFLATALPLVPALFNRVARRLGLASRESSSPGFGEDGSLKRLRLAHLLEGLALTAVGWLLLGASLGAALRGVVGEELAWTGPALARLPAVIGLPYVAGFVILVAPGGIGVREFFLTLLLAPQLIALAGLGYEDGRATAALAVIVLRLVWTAAELALAAVLYWLPPREGRSQKDEG